MALAIVKSRATLGVDAPLVTVETHLSGGLPNFTIVGLPETAVRESRERVRSAILNAQLDFPQQRITINLAPADLPKAGGRFDLAIALGILVASQQLPAHAVAQQVFIGELALSGEVRGVSGLLPALLACQRAQQTAVVPAANAEEAGLLAEADIRLCSHLLEVLQALKNDLPLPKPTRTTAVSLKDDSDFAEVVGQDAAKRALLIAAAGGHNVLLRGPPGTGKTMLASRLPTILPPLNETQAVEAAAIHTLATGKGARGPWWRPPFRAPHHSSSAVALIGGGSTLQPGEISLAHHGVLFLDELPEFSARVLEVLREPLESGCIQIARAKYATTLPARILLIAAQNLCPCGRMGSAGTQTCTCPPERVRQYQQRISGPLLDRLDLHVHVAPMTETDKAKLLQRTPHSAMTSAQMREHVSYCRATQHARANKLNAHLQTAEIQQHCELSAADAELLKSAMTRLQLSTRAFYRILRIARTIADLAQSPTIATPHLLEAINYRRGDVA